MLTGSGSDGAMGTSAVKSRGGTVIAEDPELAEFKGMPEAAVASGAVDFMLPLDEIAPGDLRAGRGEDVMTHPCTGERLTAAWRTCLVFIRDSRGFDFTGYKR